MARPDNPAWQAIGSTVTERPRVRTEGKGGESNSSFRRTARQWHRRIPRLDTDLAPLLAALAAARGVATEAPGGRDLTG